MPQGIGKTFQPAPVLTVVAVASARVVVSFVLPSQQRRHHQSQYQQGGVDDRSRQRRSHVSHGHENRYQRRADKQQGRDMPQSTDDPRHLGVAVAVLANAVTAVANKVLDRALETHDEAEGQCGGQNVGQHRGQRCQIEAQQLHQAFRLEGITKGDQGANHKQRTQRVLLQQAHRRIAMAAGEHRHHDFYHHR